MITASAYGLSAWAFVAHTDCGLGLFARSSLVAGQQIAEYAGPRLPLESISQGNYALELPGEPPQCGRCDALCSMLSFMCIRRILLAEFAAPHNCSQPTSRMRAHTGEGVAIDGMHENDPTGAPAGFMPSPAVFANHSKRPNAKLQYWPAARSSADSSEVAGRSEVAGGSEARTGEPLEEDDLHRRPSRIVLVALEPMEAGCELRFDYESGGQRGQYWGAGVRPCVPIETNWRARPPLLPPPPSGLEPVMKRLPPHLCEALDTQPPFAAEEEVALLREAPHAPPPAPPAWCGVQSARLLRLIARLEQTAWLAECIQKGTAKVKLWELVATHFPGRSARDCRNRYRQVGRTAMLKMQTDGAGPLPAEAAQASRAQVAPRVAATFDLGEEGNVTALGKDSWGLVGTDANIPNELWGVRDGASTRCHIAAFIGKHGYAQGGEASSYVITDSINGHHYAVRASFLARHLDDPADRRRLAKAAPPRVTS